MRKDEEWGYQHPYEQTNIALHSQHTQLEFVSPNKVSVWRKSLLWGWKNSPYLGGA